MAFVCPVLSVPAARANPAAARLDTNAKILPTLFFISALPFPQIRLYYEFKISK
jgi:hypothetical protein